MLQSDSIIALLARYKHFFCKPCAAIFLAALPMGEKERIKSEVTAKTTEAARGGAGDVADFLGLGAPATTEMGAPATAEEV